MKSQKMPGEYEYFVRKYPFPEEPKGVACYVRIDLVDIWTSDGFENKPCLRGP
jgi:hypothetical protein